MMTHRYLPILLVALPLIASAALAGTTPPSPIIGVKLGRIEPDTETVVRQLQAAGINTVFTGRRGTIDPEFMERCRERDIEVYAIFGVFVDAAAIREDPTLSQINALGAPMTARRKSYRLVCPYREDYRTQRMAEITGFLASNRVDGLSLDFIRYGVEWEMIKPDETPGPGQEYCFCPECLKRFSARYPLPPYETVREAASVILSRHREAWTAFKCEAITSMVKQIRDAARAIHPGIQIAIHALPWTEADYDDGARRLGGQDFALLQPWVSVFSPMNYHFMLHRQPESIHRQVVSMKRQGCTVAPCIQAGLIFRKGEVYTPAMFAEAMQSALRTPSDGINLYTWEIFRDRPEMRAVWSEHMSSFQKTHP